jgi:hypothetical protein
MSDQLKDLIPHVNAISKASGDFVYAEDLTSIDMEMEVDVIRRSFRVGEQGRVVGKLSPDMPFILSLNGIVMASRGIDNVTDVCEAMRDDLAKRRSIERFPVEEAKRIVDSGKRLRVYSDDRRISKTIQIDRARQNEKAYLVAGWTGSFERWGSSSAAAEGGDELIVFSNMLVEFLRPDTGFALDAEIIVEEVV